LAVLSFSAACGFVGGFSDNNVPEGDRCNPLSTHNDCANGAMCTVASTPEGTPFPGQTSGPMIPFCPENYCCVVGEDGGISSANPICQPGCSGGAAVECAAAGDASAPACACAEAGDPTSAACQPP
jgi:hypothetical protein